MKIASHFTESLSGFDLEKLDESDDLVYGVDGAMELAFLNARWTSNALENNADPSFFRDWGIGSPVDRALGDDLAPYYLDKFERSRETGEPWTHDYLCPAPTVMKKFQMRILPLEPEGWLVIHTKIVERPHDTDDDFDNIGFLEAYRHDDGLYRQCSHCGRFRRPDAENQWDWVPALFAKQPEATSHGLCQTCFDYYYGKVG